MICIMCGLHIDPEDAVEVLGECMCPDCYAALEEDIYDC